MFGFQKHKFLLTAALATCSFATAALSAPEPRVFNQIDVRGNERFRDGDILATSGLTTGAMLGEEELLAAVEALEYTGEFENVVITSQGDLLIIEVEESPEYSGGLTFGLGYDTDDGAFGAAGIRLDNIIGEGSLLRGNLIVAEETQRLSFDIRSPNFWSESLPGGVRFAYANYDYDNVTYNYETARIEPYLNHVISGVGAAELRFTYRIDDISDVDASASQIIQDEAGRLDGSGIGFSFATGSRFLGGTESRSDGWSLRFDQDFTGLGGDTDISTSRINLAARKSVTPSGFALRTNIELGAVTGLGSDNPRASDRFALGGARLRGFERGTIAPRDVCEGCGANGGDIETILGGNYYAVARTDLLVPLFKQRPEIETFVFYDIGSVWDVETDTTPSGSLLDGQDWRQSVGIGASFDTPLGKFETYYAIDTDGEEYDEEQKFGLTFRTQF